MVTNAQNAAKLLRTAASVYRDIRDKNQALKDQMDLNQRAYEAVAVLVEKDPFGEAPEADESEN